MPPKRRKTINSRSTIKKTTSKEKEDLDGPKSRSPMPKKTKTKSRSKKKVSFVEINTGTLNTSADEVEIIPKKSRFRKRFKRCTKLSYHLILFMMAIILGGAGIVSTIDLIIQDSKLDKPLFIVQQKISRILSCVWIM